MEKKLPDGRIVDAYPITQAQSIMYYVYNSFGGNTPVLNIGTGYYWQGDIDVDLFRQSLYEAMDRCDAFRLRFTPDKQFGLMQYLEDESGIEVEEVDLSGMSYDDAYWEMKHWTYKMIDMFNKPLHTVRIIHLENNYHGMYIKFHHLGFDGYSAKLFLSDVMDIYVSKRTGSPYPKPMKSYIEAVKKELEYLSSPKRDEDREYFTNLFKNQTEPIFNDYMLENRLFEQRKESGNPDQRYVKLHDDKFPQSKSLYYELDAETTNEIIEACEKNNMSVACVLMTGLRTTLSAFNKNEEDVSHKFMVNRRGSLLEKKSGGIRMHFFTIRTKIGPEKTFREAVDIVEDAQNEIFQHSSFHTLEMYHIMHTVTGMGSLEQTYDPMSFSYQPYMETAAENEEQRKSSIGVWYNNDVSAQSLYLTVKHRPADKGFEFIFEYRTVNNPEEDLKIFYSKMLAALKLGCKNPDMTIGEILEEIKI